jgi:YidC/Oxa1 family membrane protein insertase
MSFLNPLYNALGYALAFFYSLIQNLGVAIILVTIATMIVLYPLTAKQAKSMITMQRVQPEVKKLQAKYKGDRQKLNEEVMKFYQENKINPLAGCLPLVVQLPIFYVLFRVLRTPWQHVPKTGSFNQLYTKMCGSFGSLCGTTTTKVQTITLNGVQKVIQPGTGAMHLTHLSFLGVDLTKTATDSTLSVGSALPYYILVLLVVLTGYLQTKQATARTPAANKQMGTVMKVLPVFFGIISLTFPAGLVVYFLVSNTWRLGQQELIFRRLGTGAAPASGAVGKLGSPDKNGGALDVASTERANEAKAKAAADAARDGDPPPQESKARSANPPKTPPKNVPQSPAKSRARSANPPAARRAPATRPAAQESGRGGLRGFFQLPPPPGGNGGGGRPTGPSGSGSKPAGSGGAGRPGSSPPPRSRAKKKRKR